MTIRWGILGCGQVCEVKSGPGFQKAPGSELVAVMRRDHRLAEDFARRHNVPAAYDDVDALLADPRVDAVYIAAPPGSHLELALKVAAAGKPAYVEKPMARSFEECERMNHAFALVKQPLFVAYYRRALDRFRKAKELLEAQAVGVVTGVSCRYSSAAQLRFEAAALPWRVDAERAGGGLFLDLASHSLDVLDFFFGPLLDVTGRAARLAAAGAVEDRVELTFRVADGALGSGSWNFASAVHEDRIVVQGTRGQLRLSTFGNEPVELVRDGGVEHFALPNPTHIQQPLITSIVRALEGHGEAPSTGASAARTSRVIDQALEGYYGARSGEFWKHAESWPGRRQDTPLRMGSGR